MLLRRKKHSVMELNTTSTADISFMLLIFFLVTTSMDSDKGLGRQLPPPTPKQQDITMDVNKELILTIRLNKDNVVLIDGQQWNIDDKLRKHIRHFIIERGARHIIELQVEREATYDAYFKLQNQIVRAYQELRNAASEKKYGTTYGKCSESEKQDIDESLPQRIKETACLN